jgi:hypothetical protein
VDSILLVSPEIAAVAIKNRFTLTISPLKRGETMLLVKYGQHRQTYIIQVVPRPAGSARRGDIADPGEAAKTATTSGTFTTTYSPELGEGRSVLRQTLNYRKKLSNDRTLRVAGEMFKLFGKDSQSLAIARVEDFALNRLAIGVDTATRSIDVVDSQVNISPMSLNNFTMRGFHLSSKQKVNPKKNLSANGIEVFAGLARPSLAFFDSNGGKIAGMIVPVATTHNFQARAGFIAISADKISPQARGGVVFNADAAYVPTKGISAEAEMSYSNGATSWRTRVDLKSAKYGASGEVTRFARNSPLNGIGAQYGGRRAEAFSFYWRPLRSVNAGAGYDHTQISRLADTRWANFDRSLLFSNISYAAAKDIRLTFRYADQKIETAFPGGASSFAIATRTLSIGNTYKFNSKWSNTIEGRIAFTRETNADAGLERGFSLNENLRMGWQGGSLTGFVHYNRRSPSVTSLIVRNPGLLPVPLRAAFALDPAEFLRLNRERVSFLLGGIELPQTRSVDAGVRFQKTISRLNLSGEARYDAGEAYAVSQKYLYTSASASVRLDRANSVQINGWKAIGGSGRSGMTFSYTHLFGTGGDGFQFSKLFGLNRGKVSGRVFNDLNGNGQCDGIEPGVAGVTVQLDGKRSVKTDKEGRYEFAAGDGQHKIVLVSDDLGTRLLASTPVERSVNVDGKRNFDLNFGVRDQGSIAGRVLVDLGASQARRMQPAPGLSGVKITVRTANSGSGGLLLEQVTDANGFFLFPNLRPGEYMVEIDSASLPANYTMPATTGVPIVVRPLHSSSYEVSFAPQRAVTGFVYFDKDRNGHYTFGQDEPVGGAVVSFGDRSVVSDISGAYILRGLPAGLVELHVSGSDRFPGTSLFVELGAAPETKRGVDIRLN